jgi:error-prone DNA polymerase
MTKNDAAYVELHCHSNFSLLDGASHPEDLVKRAVELGMSALALTDHDAVYGAVRFAQAAKQHGVRPLFGTELTLEDKTHLTLLVENEAGWRNLCTLITVARHSAPKGQALLPLGVLPDYTEGLIALSGCQHGTISKGLLANDWYTSVEAARQFTEWFGRDRFFIELQHHRLPEDDRLLYKLVRLAERLDLPYVATNNVHYAAREVSLLQHVLVCIGKNLTLDNSRAVRRPNSEYYLKSAQEMASVFADYPEALHNTLRIAESCSFDLMDKHKGTRTINSNTTADFHADYATLFVVLHDLRTARPACLPHAGRYERR